MKKTLILLALTAFAGSAYANDLNMGDAHSKHKGKATHMFKKADANSDKKVTFEEFMAVVTAKAKERFDKLDRNGDGVLDVEDRKK